MKKYSKLTFSLILVLAMVLQLSAVAFAANVGLVNHEVNELAVTGTVSVRGLSANAKLVTAVYDASGNVVDYDVSLSAKNAKDTFLKTNVTKDEESNTVKSFVWDAAGTNTPLTSSAELKAATEADVELFFDGVPFATAAGEALDFAKEEYTVKLKDFDADGDLSVPNVTYKLKDSSIDVDVTTDYDAMKSVIKIGSGARIADTRSVTNPNGSGKAASKTFYTRESEVELTVNYVADELFLSDFVQNGVSGGVAGSTLKYYDHVKSFDAGKVKLQVKGVTNKTSVIVIVPKTAGADKNTVLYQDSTPINWTKDSGVVTAYNYDSAYADNRLAEPFVDSRATYGQLSAYQGMAEGTVIDPNVATVNGATSVIHTGYPVKMYKVSDGETKAVYVPVYNKFIGSDDYFVSGARVTNGGTREPVAGGLSFYKINSALEGCNYIAIPALGYTYGTSDDVVFEFNVDEAVDVHVVTQSASVYFDGSAIADTASQNTSIGTRYQDLFWFMPAVYYVAAGVIDATDVIFYSSTTGGAYEETFTEDDVKYTYAPKITYKIRKYAFFKKGNSYARKDVYTLPASLIKKYGIATPNKNTATKLESFKPFAEIVAMVKKLEAKPVDLVTDVAYPTETVTFNGATISFGNDNLPLPVPEVFDAEDTYQSVAMDRLGLKDTTRFNGTGNISSYPGSYDLDDAVFLQSNIKYADGAKTDVALMYNNYTVDTLDKPGTCEENYVPRPLYTFKVNRPAEIIVFSQYQHPGLNAEGYEFVYVDSADGLKFTYSGENCREMRHVYSKVVEPGTITMKTPGNAGLYVVFVKELSN